MEVEENINEDIKNKLPDLIPTNDKTSYIKVLQELYYDVYPKYESFNFKIILSFFVGSFGILFGEL